MKHGDAAAERRVRVELNLPSAMVARLDAEARRRGVTRQALIKMWVCDQIDRAA